MTTQRGTPTHLVIGHILRPHGIKGELKLKVLTDYPERISELETVFLGADPESSDLKAYTVKSSRSNKDYILLTLKEITNRNMAETLRNQYVMVDIEHAIPLEQDEFYLYELIGLNVVLEDGTEIGTIQNIIETGANDVYVLNNPLHGEILIPAHKNTIIQYDFEQGIITVRLPEGLLPFE